MSVGGVVSVVITLFIPFNNFWRDVLISFKFCRTLYHYKIQVRFNIGNHLPNFGLVMALFDLVFVVRFCSITFEGLHWFHSNFAELHITVKYKSSLILVIICQILAELWPFFDLDVVGMLILVSDQYLLQGCIDFIESLQKDVSL